MRTTRRLAVGLAALSFLFVGATMFMTTDDWPLTALGAFSLWIAVAASVGALVASRRSENAVGWILLCMSFFIGSGLFTTQYAAYALETHRGSLPLGLAAAWLQTWLFVPAGGMLFLLVLLFPTGRLPSPRWRWVAYVGVVGTVFLAASFAFLPGPLEALRSVPNPLGISGARPVLETLRPVAFVSFAVAVLAALASVLLRLRRAKGDERQQVKWFAYTAVSLVAFIVAGPILADKLHIELLGFVPWYLGLLAIPISIGMAVLRYRLYDIDRIISRTVTYAILIALLGAVYVGLVIGLGRLIEPLTSGSDLVVAASTLIVAALFRPVLRRVQGVIERRFNRSRFDAERTIEAFTAHLREEVDIDALEGELTAVIARTMQPAHVALWMRDKG